MTFFSSISRYALFLLIFLAPLPKASVPGWAQTCILFITLWALFFFLLIRILNEDQVWISTPINKPLSALYTLSILSGILSVHHYTSIWSVAKLTNYLVVFLLISALVRHRNDFKRIVFLLLIMAGFLSIFGFIKWAGYSPFPWWEYSAQSGVTYRLSSTFVNADHFAGYLEMVTPILIALMVTGYLDDKIIPGAALAVIMLLALILTHSRGGWIAFFVGLIFLIACLLTDKKVNKKRAFWGILAGLFMILGVVFVEPTLTKRLLTFFQMEYIPNFRGRIIAWRGVVNLIFDHPFFGTGPGTFSGIFTQYQPAGTGGAFYNHAHNDYLEFISEVGIFLIPLLIWIAIVVFRCGFKKMKNPSRLIRGVTAGAMAGIVSIMVHTIADFPLQTPANALILTILVALVVSPIPKHQSKDASTPLWR